MVDEVHEVRINKVIFVVEKNEEGEPSLRVANYEVVNNAGGSAALPAETKFYESLDKFRQKSPIIPEAENGRKLMSNASGCRGNWWFNGVEALEFESTDHIKSFAHSVVGFTIIEGSVPSELYFTRYEAYAYNDVPTVDLDGKAGKKDGYLKPLLFNDKQKEIMERFKAISKEIQDANIRLICIENDIYFVNGEKLKDAWLDYDKGDDSAEFVPAKEHYDHGLKVWWQSWENIWVDFEEQ
jgi:hypothetical protein